jgi:hypothetical protein
MRSSVGWELVLASGAGSSLVVRKEGHCYHTYRYCKVQGPDFADNATS